jgi:hypothetical protein
MLWSLTADLLTAPGSLLAVATVLAAILVVALFADRGTAARRTPVPVRAVALRERARRAAAIRQRDPDAAGRPRPRAPSTRGPAA